MKLNQIIQHNVMDRPWPIPDQFVNCIVTSPPYWGLRDYGVDGQLGLEPTPEEFIARMVLVFEEAKRVLRDDVTLWLNIGDTYFGGKGKNGASVAYSGAGDRLNKNALSTSKLECRPNDMPIPGLKPKDLVGIPWMLALALRSVGWYLRQDIIWNKSNPMPESVQDRCTKAHEYIFLLSKSAKYYFDAEAVKEPMAASSIMRLSQDVENQHGSLRVPGKTNGPMRAVQAKGNRKSFRGGGAYTNGQCFENSADVQNESVGNIPNPTGMRNKRSVWQMATVPFKESHFATFPEELPTTCILAGCPVGGIVFDPFMGAGTTAVSALGHGRNFIGLEINPEYINIAERRLKKRFGLFFQTAI